MKKLSLYLLIISALGVHNACTSAPDAIATNDLTGVYNVISDPIRCALPTTNQVTITNKNGEYVATYVSTFTRKKETSPALTVEKVGDVSIIMLGTQKVGKYGLDTYYENGKSTEGMLLMINIAKSPTTGYFEFMGKK